MIVVMMGVAGAGKTYVGRALAQELRWPFFDADDFHSPENVAKMRSGVPLDESDRAAWLDELSGMIENLSARGEHAVIACSGLRADYRRRLDRAGDKVVFVYLKGTFELIEERLKARANHFFGHELLRSQFDALEEPEDAIVVDAGKAVDAITRDLTTLVRSRLEAE